MASAFFGPGLVAGIQGCQSKLAETEGLLVLGDKQFKLVSALADTILPKTDTPSATEVEVPRIMDLLLRDVYETEAVESFLAGLELCQTDCRSEVGKDFEALSTSERAVYLSAVDKELSGTSHGDLIPFYRMFKKLCIEIYFQTEEGIKQNLKYDPIPGGYVGDVKMEPGEKIEVGNQM